MKKILRMSLVENNKDIKNLKNDIRSHKPLLTIS